MGRKRKAGGRPDGERTLDRKDEYSKMKITTYEDVADSEDEFHLNRDRILLDEGPAAKRARKWKEQDAFLEPSDEEVLDYSDDLDDEDEEHEDNDEEVADYDAQSDNGDDLGKRAEEEEEDDLGGWGPSKKDYYDADVIETEQDALDEEAEARRLQKKQLQGMTEADFGFDEDEWLGQDGAKAEDSGMVVTEVLPQLQITEDMGEQERLKILKARYPEFEHIAKEYLRLQPLYNELASAANAAERLVKSRAAKTNMPNRAPMSTPMAVTKYRACAAYLAAMAMYFAILGSTATEGGAPAVAMDPTELHEHAVMESLLKCQRTWTRVESLPVADPMVEASNGDELSVIEEASPGPEPQLSQEIARENAKKQKKSKAQVAAQVAQAESEARRAEKLLRTEQELAALSSLTDKKALRKAAKQKKPQEAMLNLLNAEDSDFGEETSLTAHELAEKARKKKSLRFYTSQIAQKINKRDAAGKDYGGDVDVPHRERLRDRQARLQAEAERRSQNKNKGPGAAPGEGGETSDDDNDAAPRGAASDDDEGYYDMVASRNQAKKKEKQDLAAAYAQAAKDGGRVVQEETVGADGKRKITYNIEKNKGVTAQRNKKQINNPRVKKKLRYAAAQQKLKSMRPVYKGGEGKGGYGGELTGIKKGLVRSTKL